MNPTAESLIKDYADPIEQQEIDKFICSEMGRQIHRYIKGMSGTKQAMLKFEERLASLSVPEKEKAIAQYGFEPKGIGRFGLEDDFGSFGGKLLRYVPVYAGLRERQAQDGVLLSSPEGEVHPLSRCSRRTASLA